jgi:diadenylate cyclase
MQRWIDYLLGPESGWHDGLLAALDVAIVGYLCFRVLLLIRGTRAVQVLVGLFLLGLGYLGAQWLGLMTLEWLLGRFLTYSLFFGLIVLFQADIRRALAQLGRGRLLSRVLGGERATQVGVIDALARAAGLLSRRKVGALIAIERAGDLVDVTDTGVKLDAALSSELLLALFHPGGPLHDGAAVVRGGRVIAARCLLPLAQAALARDLGTRHRAALGLAEEIDAVVVVTSEERGEISLAVDGALRRGLSEQELRTALRDALAGASGRRVPRQPTSAAPGPQSTREPRAAL